MFERRIVRRWGGCVMLSMYMTAGAQPTTPTSTLTPVPTHLFRVRYYRTGDLGEVFYERGEARIRLVDRCSFAIKMQNSEWLAPSRLEAALENAPSVDQVSQTAVGPPHVCGSAPNAWLRCQPACVPLLSPNSFVTCLRFYRYYCIFSFSIPRAMWLIF